MPTGFGAEMALKVLYRVSGYPELLVIFMELESGVSTVRYSTQLLTRQPWAEIHFIVY
jgi:hypothetical protein